MEMIPRHFGSGSSPVVKSHAKPLTPSNASSASLALDVYPASAGILLGASSTSACSTTLAQLLRPSQSHLSFEISYGPPPRSPSQAVSLSFTGRSVGMPTKSPYLVLPFTLPDFASEATMQPGPSFTLLASQTAPAYYLSPWVSSTVLRPSFPAHVWSEPGAPPQTTQGLNALPLPVSLVQPRHFLLRRSLAGDRL